MFPKSFAAFVALICLGLHITGQTLLPIIQNGKWGYMNENGEMIIPAIYDDAKMFHHSLFANVSKNGKIFQIDKKGSVVNDEEINIVFRIRNNDNGYYIFLKPGSLKYGLMDAQTASIILNNDFDAIDAIGNNLVYVFKNGQKGVFNVETRAFYKTKFDHFHYNVFTKNITFNDSSSFWITDEKLNLLNKIDATEQVKITNKYLIFSKGNIQLITDTDGNILKIDSVNQVIPVNDNLLMFKAIDSVFIYSVLNKKFSYLTDVDDIQMINQKYAQISHKNNLGLIDSLGQVICSAQFKFIHLETQFFIANKDDGYYLIQYNGKTINSVPFEFVSNFKMNKAIVKSKEKSGLIGLDGKVILDMAYEHILINSDFAKCYNSNNLTIIKFNVENKIVGREDYQNVNTVRTNTVDFESTAHNKSQTKLPEKYWVKSAETNKWGLFSKEIDRFVIPHQFTKINKSNNEYTVVFNGTKINVTTPISIELEADAEGLVSLKNESIIIPCSYTQIDLSYLEFNFIIARNYDGKFKIFDTEGRLIASNITWYSQKENGGIRIYTGGKIAIAHTDTARYPVESLNQYIKKTEPSKNIYYSKFEKYRSDTNIVITLSGGKWAFINSFTKRYFDFDYLSKVNSNIVAAAQDGKFTLLNQWQPIYPFQFDKIKDCRLNDKEMFLISNKYEIPGIYDIEKQDYKNVNRALKIYPIKNGRAKVEFEKNPDLPSRIFNFVDQQGELISTEPFDFASDFECGYATVKMGRKWLLIDTIGTIKISNLSHKVIIGSENRVYIKQKGKTYLADMAGKLVSEVPFNKIFLFRQGYAIASNYNNRWGIINDEGNELLPFHFDCIKATIHPDLFLTSNRKNYNFYDIVSKTNLLKKVSLIPNKQREIVILKKNKTFYLVDQQKQVRSLPPQMVPYFSNSIITLVKKGNKYLTLRTVDFEIIAVSRSQFIFPGEDVSFNIRKKVLWLYRADGDSVNLKNLVVRSPFINGFAVVSNENGKFNFINKSGKLLMIDFVDDAKPFEGIYTAIKVDKCWGIINQLGVIVIEPHLNDINLTEGKYLTFNKSSLFSLVDQFGEFIIDKGYKKIDFDQQGFILFHKAGNCFWTDSNGKEIKPLSNVIAEQIK